MKKTIFFLLFVLTTQIFVHSQSLTGNFSGMSNQRIQLYGFDKFDTYVIENSTTDANGNFSLAFSSNDYGMGFLQSASGKNYFVVLADEAIEIQGKSIAQPDVIQVVKGTQNQAFLRYATEQPKREQVFSAWDFLQKKYNTDALFSKQDQTREDIQSEIQRLEKEEQSFLDHLPKDSYVKWFLPIRKLVSNVSVVAQYRPEEIPKTLASLRAIDYTDDRLYKSGLLNEAIESHVWFIENSSGSLDQVFKDLNTTIDIIIDQLKDDNDKFNWVSSKLFEVLEERSLFTSSEYLAKRLLEGDDCGCLNIDLEKRLHKYGKMATGATAPDIHFTEFTYYPEGPNASKLSELPADYYLVVFAAGWCPHCNEAMPKVADYYPQLKAKNMEVILVSLDENSRDFAKFAAPLPFVSTTDFQKWDGQAATDYQVFSTPSYFMLDKNLKIQKKLKSVDHLKAWVEQMIPN